MYRAGEDKARNKKGEERGEESDWVAVAVTVKAKKESFTITYLVASAQVELVVEV